MKYQDKVAVVTGASRGLGAGLARTFAEHGLRLGLCARSLPAAAAGGEALCRAVDVTDAEAIDGFVAELEQRYGIIDVWINNAGVLDPIAPLRDIDPDDFRRLFEINVMGVVNGTRAFIRHRRRQGGGGVLVNISSGAARSAYAGWSAYCASKAAVDRLSEAVQLEEAEQGLRVYALAPGIVDTDMQSRIRSTPRERFPMVDKFQQLKDAERFNSPTYVARELLALAFDPARRPEQVVVRLDNEWER